MNSAGDTHRWVGCPIRTPRDQNLLAVPPGFSQRATSFIASWCQGIHQMPFSCSKTKPIAACYCIGRLTRWCCAPVLMAEQATPLRCSQNHASRLAAAHAAPGSQTHPAMHRNNPRTTRSTHSSTQLDAANATRTGPPQTKSGAAQGQTPTQAPLTDAPARPRTPKGAETARAVLRAQSRTRTRFTAKKTRSDASRQTPVTRPAPKTGDTIPTHDLGSDVRCPSPVFRKTRRLRL